MPTPLPKAATGRSLRTSALHAGEGGRECYANYLVDWRYAGSFVCASPLRRGVSLSQPWSAKSLESALTVALLERLTTVQNGLDWQQHQQSAYIWFKQAGLQPLVPSVRGNICIIATDTAWYAYLPFRGDTGAEPAFFDHLVYVVELAAEHGLYVALLPTWSDKLTAPWGQGPRLFTVDRLDRVWQYAMYLAGRVWHCQCAVAAGRRPASVDAL